MGWGWQLDLCRCLCSVWCGLELHHVVSVSAQVRAGVWRRCSGTLSLGFRAVSEHEKGSAISMGGGGDRV
jgi:hypothetical protein